ncbi:GerW family sporulation protein [Paenibacillus sp. RC67]|uniref:GerW family sporulation protein n=1 Tax=Paenibacillus sp. RC67 TaxID=3039392 RepID=UPI0024ADB040|nr:GerW family sporulation protein [Paenibacillus sp. RC67]
MSEHPLQSFIRTAMEQLKETVNVNTTMGEPVVAPDGTLIIPVCKVSFGFASGGSEFGHHSQDYTKTEMPFGGGTGGGVSVTPLAFLIIGHAGVQTITLENSSNIYSKMLELAPQLLDKLQSLISQHHSEV